jgi:hypothetical protein
MAQLVRDPSRRLLQFGRGVHDLRAPSALIGDLAQGLRVHARVDGPLGLCVDRNGVHERV